MEGAPTTPTSLDHRPRPQSRGISFRSTGSGSQHGSPKATESPRDKAQRDSIWTSKTNPNAAINEVQPAVAHITEESTLQNIRTVEHRDISGNVIADPDRSNPTRSRMERPLDTIRSFEKAIDEGYNRRTSYMRQDSENWDQQNQFASRRSSYFGGSDVGPNPNRPMQNGGGYYGGQGYNGPPRARFPGGRMQSDPHLMGHRPYPVNHNHQPSYETVNTGYTNGSDSTGPWANSTDPSSENSSIDKVNAMNKPTTPMDPYNNYAQNGYSDTIMEEHGAGMYGNYYQQNGNRQHPGSYPPQGDYGRGPQNGGYSQTNDYAQTNGNGGREMYARTNSNPQLPQPTQPRKPIQLGGTPSADAGSRPSVAMPPQTRKEPEKRQSWLKRRFSKKS